MLVVYIKYTDFVLSDWSRNISGTVLVQTGTHGAGRTGLMSLSVTCNVQFLKSVFKRLNRGKAS